MLSSFGSLTLKIRPTIIGTHFTNRLTRICVVRETKPAVFILTQEIRKRHIKRNKKKKLLSQANAEVDRNSEAISSSSMIGVVTDGSGSVSPSVASSSQHHSPNAPQRVDSPHVTSTGGNDVDVGFSSGEESPSPVINYCDLA